MSTASMPMAGWEWEARSTAVIESVATRNLQPLESYIERRLREIKAEMGSKLVCHPAYKFTPRHSTNPDIYVAARQPYLDAIAAAAAADCERNPAYHTAQTIRQAFGA